MSTGHAPRALIADDEPALRAELERLLADAWPDLVIVASVGDGAAAIEAIERLKADVAFLDIRMPPPSGLEVARIIGAETAVVFVTAYDAHAIEAFERAAVDYLLKPVTVPRIEETVTRLQRWMAGGKRTRLDAQTLASLIGRVMDTAAYLHWLKVGRRERVELVAVDDVCFFRAERKYTAALTSDREHLATSDPASPGSWPGFASTKCCCSTTASRARRTPSTSTARIGSWSRTRRSCRSRRAPCKRSATRTHVRYSARCTTTPAWRPSSTSADSSWWPSRGSLPPSCTPPIGPRSPPDAPG